MPSVIPACAPGCLPCPARSPLVRLTPPPPPGDARCVTHLQVRQSWQPAQLMPQRATDQVMNQQVQLGQLGQLQRRDRLASKQLQISKQTASDQQAEVGLAARRAALYSPGG
jgi:hypothetical protein